MAGSTVEVRRDDHVGVITLNRPEVLNALNSQLNRDLHEAVLELSDDPGTHVIVMTGAGRAFCAGADINEMADREAAQGDGHAGQRGQSNVQTISTGFAFSPKPVIAALNGLAYGGGALLASVADIRYGCEHSRFRYLGIVAGRINSTWSLSVVLGISKAKELLLSGRVVEPEEALSIGLLDRLVPSGELLDETMKLAHMIAGNQPEMVQAGKQLLNDYAGMGLQERAHMEHELRSTKLTPPPVREAFKDFLDKR